MPNYTIGSGALSMHRAKHGKCSRTRCGPGGDLDPTTSVHMTRSRTRCGPGGDTMGVVCVCVCVCVCVSAGLCVCVSMCVCHFSIVVMALHHSPVKEMRPRAVTELRGGPPTNTERNHDEQHVLSPP